MDASCLKINVGGLKMDVDESKKIWMVLRGQNRVLGVSKLW